jgi:pimeloyl-ACP methyl ester carboxylesterase
MEGGCPALLEWRHVEVEGRRAAYGVGGPAGGPVAVFLHGWGLSGRTYRAPLKRLLRRGLRVYAPSLPARGSDARPDAPGGLARHARWVEGFCDAVACDAPVVLIGHSFGGAVAIRTAHDTTRPVRGLVLVNAVGGGAWRHDRSGTRSMAERPWWDWGLHLSRDVLPLRQMRRVLPTLVDGARANLLHDPRAWWRAAGLARAADLTAELRAVTGRGLPVAAVWSTGDTLVTRASFEALCAAAGGVVAATVPGAHSWLLADPDRFAETVTDLLRSLGVPLAARPGIGAG